MNARYLLFGSALLAIFFAAPGAAQRSPTAPELIQDAFPGNQPWNTVNSGEITPFVNGTALMASSTRADGRELFATDGTAAGTRLLVDIEPGAGSSAPAMFTRAGNLTYFTAFTSTHGLELWTTDGTSSGTRRLTDMMPGAGSSQPFHLTALGNQLVFFANSAATGFELYRTDGTPQGTRLVRDINPGSPSSGTPPFGLPRLQSSIEWNGKVYFEANDGTHGIELWVTDGTAQGTSLVVDVAPGSASSNPRNRRIAGNRLWFTAAGGLWVSDGTANGSRQVTAISSFILQMEAFGSRLLFSDGNQLGITDGTTSGTQRFPLPTGSFVQRIAVNGTSAFVAAQDSTRTWRLLRTDGTAAGTREIGTTAGTNTDANLALLAHGSGALFGSNFVGLWRLDSAGATRIRTGAIHLAQPAPASTANKLFWLAGSPQAGLWTTGGTPAGTRFIVQTHSTPFSSSPLHFTAFDGFTVFSAVDAKGREPWVTDGSANGTRLLADTINGGASGVDRGSLFVRSGNFVYFTAGSGATRSLWRTDGTPTGTIPLQAIGLDTVHATLDLRGVFYMLAGGVFRGGAASLWRSDGTVAGTTRFRSWTSRSPLALGQLNGALHWVAHNGTEYELVRFDGQRTTVLAQITGRSSSNPIEMHATRTHLFFTLPNSGTFYDLWATDGTTLGTRPLGELRRRTAPAMVATDEYFFYGRSRPNYELVRSDGTAAGTIALAPIQFPERFLRVGRDVVFNGARTGQFGTWRSDGTAAGTSLFTSRRLQPLTAAGTRRFLATETGLVASDGTPSGTKIIRTYINPFLSRPNGAAHANGLVAVDLDDIRAGREPFRAWLGASAQRNGYPCAGGTRWPTLSATDPVMGATMTVRGQDLTTSGSTFGFLAFMPPLARPTPLLSTQCIAHGDWSRASVLARFAISRPDWSLAIPIPNIPAADRLQAILRLVVAPTNGPLLGDLTNAVRLSFGD